MVQRPPGPTNFSPLGSLSKLKASPLDLFMDLRDNHGDIVFLRLGNLPAFVIYHPDQLEEVLLKKHRLFIKDQVTRDLSRTLGKGLLTSDGALWQKQRKLVAPPLQRHHIRLFAETMAKEAMRAQEEMVIGDRCDVVPAMMALTLKIVGETLFGSNVETTTMTIGHALEVVMEAFIQDQRTWRRVIPKFIPTPGRLRVKKVTTDINSVLFDIIEMRRQDGTSRDDLLSRLLLACDEEGVGMSNEQLRDECITLFVAGHETTALGLSFALYLLAKHPDVQQKLYEEAHLHLGGRPPAFEDLEKLSYTDAVISESLRLYPPVYIVGREVIEECQVGTFRAPVGMQILIPIYAIHRDERYYESADTFRPQRWLDGLSERLPRFAFLPFGGGPRVCIGNHFAWMEMKIILATLVQHLRFETCEENPPRLMPSITLRPKSGIPLRIIRRH